MGHDDLLRDFGILPGGPGKPFGRVRSTLKWHNAIFQVVMSTLLVGGSTAMGVIGIYTGSV
jgi:hypothetical protein